MTVISRNTRVISISLPKVVVKKLEETRKIRGQSRSAFITSLVEKEGEEERWRRIYRKGRRVAKRFKITSEEDIEKILHAS